MHDHVLLFKAIRALKIDVPVLSYRIVGSRIELHLYGGQVKTYDDSVGVDGIYDDSVGVDGINPAESPQLKVVEAQLVQKAAAATKKPPAKSHQPKANRQPPKAKRQPPKAKS